jgi:hypothetical protein
MALIRGAQPGSGAILVQVQVSSINTRGVGSTRSRYLAHGEVVTVCLGSVLEFSLGMIDAAKRGLRSPIATERVASVNRASMEQLTL